MSKIVLVDGANIFLRNYAVVPTLDLNGERNGGVYGFITSLSYYVKVIDPDKVIVCWDGAGGSKKRRSIIKEYKHHRKPAKPARINSNYEFEYDNIEENKIKQRVRLAQYLKDLPIIEIVVPDIEADDIIGYLCSSYYRDEKKVVVSSDKDFYQLLDEKTLIFKPTKKTFFTKNTIVEEFNIYPRNFALARAVIGDVGDNLPGIKGVGFKTLLKCFPFFSEDRDIDLSEVVDFSEEMIKTNKKKKYQKFVDGKDIIKNNLKVMQLRESIVSYSNIDKINKSLETNISFNATAFRGKLLQDGITKMGDTFFRNFRLLGLKGKD